MRPLTSSEACHSCRECCTFSQRGLYFLPMLTKSEAQRIAHLRKPLPKLRERKGGVMQVELLPSGGHFVCPFLDEGSHHCSIYSSQPLDCRLWPYMFTRSRDGKSVNLVCADRSYCRCIEKISPAEMEGHNRDILRRIRSEGILDTVKQFPGLILDCEPDTFVIAEIPELKKA